MNQKCGEMFEAESAGLEPDILNPLAVEAMREVGIDISGKKTRGVADVIQSRQTFDHVITVCDESHAEQCPLFPGTAARQHWSLPDPSRTVS